MLNSYLASVQQLLQNPAAPTSLYTAPLLTGYINQARQQLAAEGECIRALGTITLSGAGFGPYLFSSLTFGSAVGIGGANNVRSLLANGVWMTPRSYDWFTIYDLNNSPAGTGAPTEWAQYGQGENGSIFINTNPTATVTGKADCACYPAVLTGDNDPEAIPALWQTAVPFFAAYLALLSSQTSSRIGEAEKMLSYYEMFTARARRFATPEVLPGQYPQAPPPQGAGGQRPAGAG